MPHLLDVTMLWGETSGGVRRYLVAKQGWMQAHTSWRHTVRQVVHQPLGVDTDVFSPDLRDFSWRAALGLAPRARVLLYTGRFGLEKNLQVLADAVRLLGEPYVLVAMGAGPCPPRGPRVLIQPFTNNRQALARALASADVFVHASDQETFGLSALEALACGCPVVACAQGGLGELVNDQVGAWVENLSAVEFAEAIEHVFSNDPTSYAPAARNQALQHRWHGAMDRLFMRYQQLLDTR